MVSLENLVDKTLLTAYNDELMQDVINPIRQSIVGLHAPTYNAATRTIVFPSNGNVSFNAATRTIVVG